MNLKNKGGMFLRRTLVSKSTPALVESSFRMAVTAANNWGGRPAVESLCRKIALQLDTCKKCFV